MDLYVVVFMRWVGVKGAARILFIHVKARQKRLGTHEIGGSNKITPRKRADESNVSIFFALFSHLITHKKPGEAVNLWYLAHSPRQQLQKKTVI